MKKEMNLKLRTLIKQIKILLKDEDSTDALSILAGIVEPLYKIINDELDRRRRLDLLLKELDKNKT